MYIEHYFVNSLHTLTKFRFSVLICSIFGSSGLVIFWIRVALPEAAFVPTPVTVCVMSLGVVIETRFRLRSCSSSPGLHNFLIALNASTPSVACFLSKKHRCTCRCCILEGFLLLRKKCQCGIQLQQHLLSLILLHFLVCISR